MELVDMTPTWADIMPALLAALRNPDLTFESRQQIESEILRCAQAADEHNQQEK